MNNFLKELGIYTKKMDEWDLGSLRLRFIQEIDKMLTKEMIIKNILELNKLSYLEKLSIEELKKIHQKEFLDQFIKMKKRNSKFESERKNNKITVKHVETVSNNLFYSLIN